MDKKVIIGIGVLLVAGLGFVGWKMWKKKKEKKPTSEKDVKTSSYNKNPSKEKYEGKTPFKNKAEGNAFREWINKKYKTYATKINLDPSGAYDNSYIRKAWSEYGAEYQFQEWFGDWGSSPQSKSSLPFGNSFKTLLSEWNKAYKISTALNTKDVPYFVLHMRDDEGQDQCDLTLWVYDRKKGEALGGKNGKGFWAITRQGYGQRKTIASGRWSDNLRTLDVEKAVTWKGYPVGSGKTYSGGNEVGSKFAKIIGSQNKNFAWC